MKMCRLIAFRPGFTVRRKISGSGLPELVGSVLAAVKRVPIGIGLTLEVRFWWYPQFPTYPALTTVPPPMLLWISRLALCTRSHGTFVSSGHPFVVPTGPNTRLFPLAAIWAKVV